MIDEAKPMLRDTGAVSLQPPRQPRCHVGRDELRVFAHIWVKRKQPWLTLADGVPIWPEAASVAELVGALTEH